MATVDVDPTLLTELDKADPNLLPDLIRRLEIGTMLNLEDTGDVTVSPASPTVTLPSSHAALFFVEIEVVSSGIAGSVGLYHESIGGTAGVPVAAGRGGGVATINAAGTVITFPNTVTGYRARYFRRPANALTTSFPTT